MLIPGFRFTGNNLNLEGEKGVYFVRFCSDLYKRICFNLPQNVFESQSNTG